MQFRLSTLFLVFFNVAASLALFGPWRLWAIAFWIDSAIILAALCLYGAEYLRYGAMQAIAIICLGIICPGLLAPLYSRAGPAAFRAECMNNLKQIGLALHNYHDVNKHFPLANTCDKNGKPLFSWRVEILPMMEYGYLHDWLKKDEPWNSSHNSKVLSKDMPEYLCPSDMHNSKPFNTNYVAVISLGTAWREDRPMNRMDLPDGGSHTVMALEIVNSDINWAEPRDLTVEEALEGIKTGKGLHISSYHPNVINVLFADGKVRSLPLEMPLSLWKKLLAGEVKDIESIDYKPPSPPEQPIVILCLVVWLFSVVLLFRRAVKSRLKPMITT